VNAAGKLVAAAPAMPLKFEIGARTLMHVSRRLARVPLGLDDVLDGSLPALPPLDRSAHGYSITSLPEDRVPAMVHASGGMLPFVRQRYMRHYIDLAIGFDGWMAHLSSNARQGIKRKARKIAQASDGELDVRRFRTPDEVEAFHDIGRRISLRTYQERLMGSGLPDSAEFLRAMLEQAAADRLRAWLLYIDGEPAAYLYCPIERSTVIYAYVGHDPAFNDLSPGAVLQFEAMQDLFAEAGLRRFDFTEGEGQHKRQFATNGVACVDLLLLRPSLSNRVTTAALGGFNRGVALGKRTVAALGLEKFAKKVRRGA
jgi:CelD/BcsL family acetyltransferase involved in cellulose biosynthesis